MEMTREYYETLSSGELEKMLRDDLDGRRELPVSSILTICEVLSDRNPSKSVPTHENFEKILRATLG